MPTADEVLDGIEAPRLSVRISLNGTLLAQQGALADEYTATVAEDARENRNARGPEVAARIAQLAELIESTKVEFVCEAVGHDRWAKMLAEHPDPDGLEFGAGFPAAVLAETIVEPVGFSDESKVAKLLAKLSNGQFNMLWNCALTVNVGDGQLGKFGRLYALTRATEPSSTTASR